MGIYIEIIPALTESQEILGDMMTMQQLALVSEPQQYKLCEHKHELDKFS